MTFALNKKRPPDQRRGRQRRALEKEIDRREKELQVLAEKLPIEAFPPEQQESFKRIREQRRKEIGVRKVLGASVAVLVGLLSRQAALLVGLASLAAWPLVFLLMRGAILDVFSAIVLVVPPILPVAIQFGVHPVHLGIVFLATMQLGYITPPVGMNLFIASYRFERPVIEVYRATVPFFLILLATVLVITYWPALSLMLIGDG